MGWLIAIAIFNLLIAPGELLADDFTGQVVSILDGDTLEVLHTEHPERIRLSGIDCPEKGQAYSQRAKQAAANLAFGKEVTVQTHGHDKHKRTIADVILPDGMILNQELSSRAGGGIRSMRRGIRCWNG